MAVAHDNFISPKAYTGKYRFIGKYYSNIDKHGMISLPEPFNEQLQLCSKRKVYISLKAFDKCLNIYPQDKWAKLKKRIEKIDTLEEVEKYELRRNIASVMETAIDDKGRLFISHDHMEDAEIHIGSEIVIVGQLDRIEIWSKNEWNAKKPRGNRRRGSGLSNGLLAARKE